MPGQCNQARNQTRAYGVYMLYRITQMYCSKADFENHVAKLTLGYQPPLYNTYNRPLPIFPAKKSGAH